MKTVMRWLIAALMLSVNHGASAQSQEVTQLLLNVEKLAQFKQVLRQMKQGYNMLLEGYGTVKDLTKGNFSLHESFLDGLLKVSPTVKNYYAVGELLRSQVLLAQQAKQAYRSFSQSDCFRASELDYLARVYQRLLHESLQLIDELTVLLSNGALRMSEAERIQAIDKLLERQQERNEFLHHFNGQTQILKMQRLKELNDVRAAQRFYRAEGRAEMD